MKYFYFCLIALRLFTACADDDDSHVVRGITMPVNISVKTGEARMQRAPGDPGEADTYIFPKWAYIYAVTYANDDETGTLQVVTLNGSDPKGGIQLGGEWVQDEVDASVYHYSEQLVIELPEDAKSGRVYVAAAPCEIQGLAYSGTDVANMVYDVTGNTDAERNTFLKNLFSTPYNLVYEFDPVLGKFIGNPVEPALEGTGNYQYYGKIQGVGTVYPHVSVVLYHVAAKLDIKWNVAEAVREDNAVTYLQVENVPKTAYLFRPTENPKPTGSNCLQYNLINYTSLNDAMGTAWSGRKAVFLPQMYETVDATTYYPLDVRIGVNGDAIGTGQGEKAGYLVNHQETYTPDAVFTSWIAVNLNIEKKITY